MAGSAGRVRINEDRAKQGLRGLHVLWILAISLVLGVIALVTVWAFHAPGLSSVQGNAAAPPQAAPAFNEPPPAAKQTTPGEPNAPRQP